MTGTINVQGTGAPPPTITMQPQSQTVTAGATVTFTVGISGTGPFGYQWLRDGHPFAGTTTPSLTLANSSTNLAGSYTALISNLGGTAGTTPATLTVNPNGVPLPTAPTLGQTHCRSDVFDQSLPTIVITHGWQPSGDFDDPNLFAPGHPLDWMENMARAIDARLMKEGLPPNSLGNRANIVCYTWKEAFTHDFSPIGLIRASSFVDIQGNNLANKLNTNTQWH